ncbi:uncharacterized protein LOC115636305 isoform X2 [Gopherus evgoodei]|uniref:uncharacterized protein LOC115636305 isoform X2 n=1 Tax=Gopherus evgoodei TaxID=1825980 RepID=UPI0011CF98B8|nr:uncharacterized protein LOC115636305 isoform X2 [Gopherus evgoodei]
MTSQQNRLLRSLFIDLALGTCCIDHATALWQWCIVHDTTVPGCHAVQNTPLCVISQSRALQCDSRMIPGVQLNLKSAICQEQYSLTLRVIHCKNFCRNSSFQRVKIKTSFAIALWDTGLP